MQKQTKFRESYFKKSVERNRVSQAIGSMPRLGLYKTTSLGIRRDENVDWR
jgi:hypothetical protein